MDRQKKLDLITKIFFRKSTPKLWFKLVCENIERNSVVLEIGSGSGQGMQNQDYPKVKKIIGVDLDDRVLNNPYLDSALCIPAHDINKHLHEKNIDCIYSQMVMEHIDNTEHFIATQLNLLSPNGKIIHSTVSKYYWISMINNLVPETTKNWLIKNLGSGRNSEDIFPALYNLNSAQQLCELSKKLSFNYKIVRQDEPPGYLRRSIILMILYTIIHKPLQAIFPALRPTFIFIIWQKNS